MPEDYKAKSDQSFGTYCIFLHNQIVFLFLILKKSLQLTEIKKKNNKKRNYIEEIFGFKSNIKGNSNQPADF